MCVLGASGRPLCLHFLECLVVPLVLLYGFIVFITMTLAEVELEVI
jgi:hypothetical protein